MDLHLRGYTEATEKLDFIINNDTRLRRSGFGGQVQCRIGRES